MGKALFFLFYCFGCFSIFFLWAKNIQCYSIQYLITFLLCFFLGFRGLNSGADTETYLIFFDSIASGSVSQMFEPGFQFFSFLMVKFLSAEFYLLFISVLQFSFLLLALYFIRLQNPMACIWLLLAFMPGLDLATSAIRSFLAASFGALVLCFTMKYRRLYLLNYLPALFHSSYFLVPLFLTSFFRGLSWRKLNIIYMLSFFLFVLFIFLDTDFIGGAIGSYVTGYGVFSKFVRYVILKDDLLSPLVRFYFVFLSLVLSALLLYMARYKKAYDVYGYYQQMCSVVICCQFVYALISFSSFAYRFYYIYYVLQIIALVYGLSNFFDRRRAIFIYFLLLFGGFLSTYTTNKFLGYTFFTFF